MSMISQEAVPSGLKSKLTGKEPCVFDTPQLRFTVVLKSFLQ